MKTVSKLAMAAIAVSTLLTITVPDADARRRRVVHRTVVVHPVRHPVIRHRRVAIVRPWVRRPYFGTLVAGVALGTVIAVSAEPTPPSDEVCWYWTNARKTHGYWDNCG